MGTDIRSGPVPGTAARNRAASKEIRTLLAAIEEAGGTVEPSRNRDGHWKVYLDGRYIGGLACSPGSHNRSTQNDIARLRRNGLDITSKGRYRP